MVAFNDRREAIGSGDFNGPSGGFSLTTHGYDQEDRWGGMSHKEAAPEVRDYYKGQKDTKTWAEANRLAAKRAAHEGRKHGFANGADYAEAYQGHLVRVMGVKGPALAEQFGELKHRQSGYGRV